MRQYTIERTPKWRTTSRRRDHDLYHQVTPTMTRPATPSVRSSAASLNFPVPSHASTSGPIAPLSELRTASNWGTQKFNFGNVPATFSPPINNTVFRFPSNSKKLGKPFIRQSTHHASSYLTLHTPTIFTDTFNSDALLLVVMLL
jgi:hypothetical protein